MFIKQISAFVENRPGRIAEITEILASHNIDLRALSVADTTDFGILRIIVDRPDEVTALLRENRVTVTLTDVLAIKLPDKPGALMNISKIIADLQGNIIKLEHNQFVSINRNSAVELVITLEAFGPEHKQLIINTLAEHGYRPKEKMTTGIYN